MYTGSVTCCPLVIHDESADGTDRRMDRRQTVTLCFPPDAASVIKTQHRREFKAQNPTLETLALFLLNPATDACRKR